LGSTQKSAGAPVEETTPTHFVSDAAATNRISWDTDEPTLRRLGPDELEELPADDLGLDRPIFPPPPTGLDTQVDIDLALVAATAIPESPPAPIDSVPSGEPPVAEPVHEFVFEVGSEPEGSLPLPEALAAPARRRLASATYPPVRLALAPRRSPLWVIIPVAAMIGAGGVTAILVAVAPTDSTPAPPSAQQPRVHRPRTQAPAKPRSTPAAPHPGVDQLLARARASLEREDYAAALADIRRVARISRGHAEARRSMARAAVELGHADALSVLDKTDGPLREVLAVRLAMVRQEWATATRLLAALPRPLRHQPQQVLWLAEIWRRRGWLLDARGVYRRLVRDPRYQEPRLKAEAALGLSEVELRLKDRTSALKHARAAVRAAQDSPSHVLRDRAKRHLELCER
jgi:hypothetical protein